MGGNTGLLALVGLLAAGCAEVGPTQVEDVGTVDLTLRRTGAAVLTQAAGDLVTSVVGEQAPSGNIDPEIVENLTIRITRIEFLLTAEGESRDGSWIAMDLGEPVILNMVALPTEGESPLVFASGSVDPGEYSKVRLFTDSASIRFTEAWRLGPAITFEPGMDHLVTIPSGDNTGLKTDIAFSVEVGSDEDVHLLFGAEATLQNVTGTGSGRVLIAPVIKGAPSEE